MILNELTAISPIDGRYRNITNNLANYFSESALIKYRIKIEIKWLIYLLNSNFINEEISIEDLEKIDNISNELFEENENVIIDACKRVKDLESITNHDVKAVEYYIRERLETIGLKHICYLVHFGCTSEDINNLAYGLMIKKSMVDCLIPSIKELIEKLKNNAKETNNIPMLSHTHGQSATPTTVGKELAVYVHRMMQSLKYIDMSTNDIQGKFSGATGTFGAWNVAYPNVDWLTFNKQFVESLDLRFNPLTTQIENHDEICMLFSSIKNFNMILQDFNSDMWLYISMGYFKQKVVETETGSSVMPHKVNPINHENSMANIRLANSMFDSFTNNLQVSRMQRDLSDSSMLRNIGVAVSHTLISIKQSIIAFDKMQVNVDLLNQDLDNNPAVLAEAIQTMLRKNKYDNAYELLKEYTRGKDVTLNDLYEFVNGLNILEEDKKNLLSLTPNNYLGLANKLCDLI